MNKKILSKLTVLGVGASVIAPIAATVACDSAFPKTDVGFVLTPDGKITDGFFKPQWNAIKVAAEDKTQVANYIEVKKTEAQAAKDAVATLVDAGAKVIFQPGFMNTATVLDNAIKYPNVKFLGVSYTKFVASTKMFTDTDNVVANMKKFDDAKNLGLIHFKTHEQGFMSGYISAATYFAKNDQATSLNFSVISSKAYQDTTAMLDGYIAGVKAYAAANNKTAELKQSVEKGGYFTDITVENGSFNSTNDTAAAFLKTKQKVDILFVADPNSIASFHGKGMLLASDGGDYAKNFDDVVVATDKDWNLIFKKATEAALATNDDFVNNYHEKMALATYDAKELIIAPTKTHYDVKIEPVAATALKTWESSLSPTDETTNIYLQDDGKGNETAEGTVKGLAWYDSLK